VVPEDLDKVENPPDSEPAAEKPGEKPETQEEPEESGDKRIYHVVGEGETLWRIAKAYGIDMQEIARANDLKDTTVQVGQKLYMPGAAEQVEVEKYRPPKTGKKFVRNEAFGYPCVGTVAAGFGSAKGEHKLEGLEFSVRRGAKVVASRTGEVVMVAQKFPGYGMVVVLQHGPSYMTFYGYLSDTSLRVGDAVARGEIIGKSGKEPRTGKSRLHFRVYEGTTAVNPLEHLR
jgi:murein DD-endopeptidase MepM/ murein hydrolase activator NlpD